MTQRQDTERHFQVLPIRVEPNTSRALRLSFTGHSLEPAHIMDIAKFKRDKHSSGRFDKSSTYQRASRRSWVRLLLPPGCVTD